MAGFLTLRDDNDAVSGDSTSYHHRRPSTPVTPDLIIMRKNFQTQLSRRLLGFAIALPALLSGAAFGQYAQKNVVQPGDPIIASSANSPSTEGVANAIDGTTAKYLNFDMNGNVKTAGFVVTPSVGQTWVTGIGIETAND